MYTYFSLVPNKFTGELISSVSFFNFYKDVPPSEMDIITYSVIVKTDEEGNWVKCLIPNNPYFDFNITQMKPHCGFTVEHSWIFESGVLYTNEPVHLVIDGVEDRREVKSRLFCYPNPIDLDQTLQVVLPVEGQQSNFSARLVNLSGQIIYEDDLTTKQFEIATSNLQAGIYWLLVENGEKSYLEQIVVW